MTSLWFQDGSDSLWGLHEADLRTEYAYAIDEPTELWPRQDGLTKVRWELWRARLNTLAQDTDTLWDETKAAAASAVTIIDSLITSTD